MDGPQLEAWAASKVAQNIRSNPNWKPVLLYRNEEANGMGALFTTHGTTRILTAGHLFWRGLPPCSWTYRALKPESNIRLPLIGALPFENNSTADLAICTPGTVLQVISPLPNFYLQGTSWSGNLEVRTWPPGEKDKKIISTISGEYFSSVGEVTCANAPYEAFDYASMPGESGTVLYNESDTKKVYVLKGDSPELAKHCQANGLCKSGKITIALRLSIT